MSLVIVFSSVGLFVYGYLCHQFASAELCAFLDGILAFGVTIGLISLGQYALDAYRDLSNEIFIMTMTFKNFLFYGLTWFVNDWIAKKGREQMFFVWGGIDIFVVRLKIFPSMLIFQCLLAIPIYIFEKRLRSLWARYVLSLCKGS